MVGLRSEKMSEKKTETSTNVNRRTALGVIGGLVVGGVVGAAGGYYAGMSSVPPAPGAMTSTVTQTVPGAASTLTVTAATAAIGPSYKFAWIVHGIDDPFFVPSLTGVKDIDSLLGVSTQVIGPPANDVPTQVADLGTALSGGFNGIACSFPDPTAFNDLVNKGVAQGIPIVGFNVDANNKRMGYVGNSPAVQGTAAGNRILASGIGKGDRVLITDVVTVGSCHIRATTMSDICKAAGVTVDVITIRDYSDLAGMTDLIRTDLSAHAETKLAHGSGSADTVAICSLLAQLKTPGFLVGGYDLNPPTLKAIQSGTCTWTVADIPYLQGYVSILLLWMWLQSHHTVTANMDTGLAFVDASNVANFIADTHYI
jgi:simple sugar transport system substrate-binding protein